MGEYRSKKTGSIIPAGAVSRKLAFVAEWVDKMYVDQQKYGLTDEETINQWWHILKGARWPREKVLKVYRIYKENNKLS